MPERSKVRHWVQAKNGHSNNQCTPCTISQLPGLVSPDVIEEVSRKMLKDGLGRWTTSMTEWVQKMQSSSCRCGQIGVHCCPRTVIEGEADHHVHPVSQEYVFRALEVLQQQKSPVIAITSVQSVGVQAAEVEEIAIIQRVEVAVQAAAEGEDQSEDKMKQKETSKERRIRRLQSKKRKKEEPLKPFAVR
eukprot:EG_transcript_23813